MLPEEVMEEEDAMQVEDVMDGEVSDDDVEEERFAPNNKELMGLSFTAKYEKQLEELNKAKTEKERVLDELRKVVTTREQELNKIVQDISSTLHTIEEQTQKEQAMWKEAGNKFKRFLPKGTRIVFQFISHTYIVVRSILLAGGQNTYFTKMFSGRLPIEKEGDNRYLFNREGCAFKYVLRFLQNLPIFVEDMTPAERLQLVDDANHFEMPGLLKLIDEVFARVQVGTKLFLVNKSDAIRNLGKGARLTKMLQDEATVYPIEFEGDYRNFEKYVLKRIQFGRIECINGESLSEAERASVFKEEVIYGMGLMSMPALFDVHNSILLGENNNIVSKVAGGNGAWDCNSLSTRPLPFGGRFKFRVTYLTRVTGHIMVGIAPATFNKEGATMHSQSGWYYYFSNGNLYSGPPTAYNNQAHFGHALNVREWVDIVVDRAEKSISVIANGETKEAPAYSNVFQDEDDLRICIMIHNHNEMVEVGDVVIL
eukprot:m.91261 g.91261  ORF g.91261 m.91261 type:complete len:483 (-) comp8867_c0_seq1:1304-2752(-)